jgi:hypothetical protein
MQNAYKSNISTGTHKHPQNTENLANPTLVHKIDQRVYQSSNFSTIVS